MAFVLDILPSHNAYFDPAQDPIDVFDLEDIRRAATDIVELDWPPVPPLAGGQRPAPNGVLAAYRHRNGIVVFAAFRYYAGPFSDGTGPTQYVKLFDGEGQSIANLRQIRSMTFGEDGTLEHVNLKVLSEALRALRRWFD